MGSGQPVEENEKEEVGMLGMFKRGAQSDIDLR